jgi:hypothetical protein
MIDIDSNSQLTQMGMLDPFGQRVYGMPTKSGIRSQHIATRQQKIVPCTGMVTKPRILRVEFNKLQRDFKLNPSLGLINGRRCQCQSLIAI